MEVNNYSTLGVLGYPLKQSLSPFLHNYWLKHYKLEYSYCKFELKDISEINLSIKRLKIKGLNVTIPYKKNIISYLDKVDKTASFLKAVNTVKNNNGILEGYNTDVKGFVNGLKKFRNLNTKRPAVVIGAGGASQAIVYSLVKEGFKKIFLMNRTRKKAEQLSENYQEVSSINWMEKDVINNAEIIVNTTSLGMTGYQNLIIPLTDVSKETKIYDIVYNPENTELIKEAKKNKLEYITGLTMFLGQAQESFKIWFNIKPTVSCLLLKKIKNEIQKK